MRKTENVRIPEYDNKQYAAFCILLYTLGIFELTCAWVVQQKSLTLAAILAASGFVILFLAYSFHYLHVYDAGDRLRIQFGPLPLFRTSIGYSDIQSVEAGITSLFDGWGIHYGLRGWVWNIWGRDCVVIRHRNRIFHLGSNDAKSLARFLQSRIELTQASSASVEHP